MKVDISRKICFKKIISTAILFFLLFSVSISAQLKLDRDFIYFTNDQISILKEKLNDKSNESAKLKKKLDSAVKKIMTAGPWSVTYTETPVPTKDKHDYFSESRYWWPDPKNPNGPYIRKDGEANPDRIDDHRIAIEQMSNASLLLSMYGYLYNDKAASERAVKIIYTWFLDPSTKMNPNMIYAQSIRGRNVTRGTGILDSRSFYKVLEGVNFLKKSGVLSSTVDAGLKKWFGEFQSWLINSKNGIDEKYSGNNHSTWFAVQLGAIAQYLRDNNVLIELFDHTKNYLIENQFEADGSMPREEARTLSLHYSVFNLDAFSIILRQADLSGDKLWDYENSKKSSFKKSVEYVTPFLRDPESWTKSQINEYKGENRIYLAFTGWGLDDANLLGLYKEFLIANYGKLDSDPFTLLTSLILINDERK
jgi:hypothetical protein